MKHYILALILAAGMVPTPSFAMTMTNAEAKHQLTLESENLVKFGNPFGKTGKFEELYDSSGKPWWMIALAKEAWSMEKYGNPFGYFIPQRIMQVPNILMPEPIVTKEPQVEPSTPPVEAVLPVPSVPTPVIVPQELSVSPTPVVAVETPVAPVVPSLTLASGERALRLSDGLVYVPGSVVTGNFVIYSGTSGRIQTLTMNRYSNVGLPVRISDHDGMDTIKVVNGNSEGASFRIVSEENGPIVRDYPIASVAQADLLFISFNERDMAYARLPATWIEARVVTVE